jgi:hypothetical protein
MKRHEGMTPSDRTAMARLLIAGRQVTRTFVHDRDASHHDDSRAIGALRRAIAGTRYPEPAVPDCDYCDGAGLARVADDSPIGYAQVCAQHLVPYASVPDLIIARWNRGIWYAV